jgi:hypothetical protein
MELLKKKRESRVGRKDETFVWRKVQVGKGRQEAKEADKVSR